MWTLSHFSLLPTVLLSCREASCKLIGQSVLLSSPHKVCRPSCLVTLLHIDKEGAELDGKSRPNQANPTWALWTGMVNPPADGMHVQSLWAKWDGELLRTTAVRQQLLLFSRALQQVGEDHRSVITPQEIPLPAAQGQEGEILFVTPTLICAQTTEEEDQELFICLQRNDRNINGSHMNLKKWKLKASAMVSQ